MCDPGVWIVERKGVKGTTYSIRWIDPASGKWRRESCGRDKRRARSRAERKRNALAAGLNDDVIRVPWDKFCERVLEAKATDVRASSLTEYRHTLEAFTEAIRPMAPDRVQHEDVKKFLRVREQAGDRTSTREKHRKVLRLLFYEGIRLRHLRQNPVKGVKALKSVEKDWHMYEPEEVDALLRVADDKFWGPLVYLAYTTGLRRGELLNLTWADVDLDANVLKVNPKSCGASGGMLLAWAPKDHERRVVPLTDHGALWLQRLRVAGDTANPYVFLPTVTYKRLLAAKYEGRNPVSKFTTQYQKLCKNAGVFVDAFHSLRKSCVTRWLEDGVVPHEVQKLAGHSSIETTIRDYSKVRTKGIESARRVSASYEPGTLPNSCRNSAG